MDPYRLRLIPDRNRNWLHGGSNPSGSTLLIPNQGENNFSFQFSCSGQKQESGYSTVRLVCLVWDQEVAGSNPAIPTKRYEECMVTHSSRLERLLN